jgi:hypothetical protein
MNLELKVMREHNIPYSWETIYVGRKMNLLKPEVVEHYALEYLENNPKCTDPYIAELAFGAQDTEINDILEKIFKDLNLKLPKPGDIIWNIEKRKWRYLVLNDLLEKYQEKIEEFLRKFDEVYCDFDHSEDMEPYVSTAPVSELYNDVKTEKEYLETRLNEIKKFIEDERESIRAV